MPQVCGSRRFAALVRLDITRRDPLRLTVASPLADVPRQPQQLAIAAGEPLVLALEPASVPEEPSRDNNRNGTPVPATTA